MKNPTLIVGYSESRSTRFTSRPVVVAFASGRHTAAAAAHLCYGERIAGPDGKPLPRFARMEIVNADGSRHNLSPNAAETYALGMVNARPAPLTAEAVRNWIESVEKTQQTQREKLAALDEYRQELAKVEAGIAVTMKGTGPLSELSRALTEQRATQDLLLARLAALEAWRKDAFPREVEGMIEQARMMNLRLCAHVVQARERLHRARIEELMPLIPEEWGVRPSVYADAARQFTGVPFDSVPAAWDARNPEGAMWPREHGGIKEAHLPGMLQNAREVLAALEAQAVRRKPGLSPAKFTGPVNNVLGDEPAEEEDEFFSDSGPLPLFDGPQERTAAADAAATLPASTSAAAAADDATLPASTSAAAADDDDDTDNTDDKVPAAGDDDATPPASTSAAGEPLRKRGPISGKVRPTAES